MGFESTDTLGGRAGCANGKEYRGLLLVEILTFWAGGSCDLGNELVDSLEERRDASPSACPFVARCDVPLALVLAPLGWATRTRFESDGDALTAWVAARDDFRLPSTMTELGPFAAGFFHGGEMRRGSLSAAEISSSLRFRVACRFKFSSLSFASERSGLRGVVPGEDRSDSDGEGVACFRRGEAGGDWMFGEAVEGCVSWRACRAGIASNHQRGAQRRLGTQRATERRVGDPEKWKYDASRGGECDGGFKKSAAIAAVEETGRRGRKWDLLEDGEK
jgi:hypothetical protein